jgi:hypothetical protein
MKRSVTSSVPQRARRSAAEWTPPKLVASATSSSAPRNRCARSPVASSKLSAALRAVRPHARRPLGVAGADGDEHEVGMTRERLRRAVHHGVGAVLERALAQRRGERVVDRQARAGRVRGVLVAPVAVRRGVLGAAQVERRGEHGARRERRALLGGRQPRVDGARRRAVRH